jgi:hypothetical protein
VNGKRAVLITQGLLALAALVFGGLAIWTGDGRWGLTLMLPLAPFLLGIVIAPIILID